MTKSMVDIVRSDAEISALAGRSLEASNDAALRTLSAWTAEIDRRPVRRAVVESHVPSGRGHVASRVVALTIALTLSSSGVAAAVKGDPWAPLTFVVAKIRTFGQSEAPGRPPVGIPDGGQLDVGRAGDSAARGEAEAQHQASRGSRALVQDPSASRTVARPLEAGRSGHSDGDTSTQSRRHPSRVVPVPAPHHRPPAHKPGPAPNDEPPTADPWSNQTPAPPTPPDGSDLPDEPGTADGQPLDMASGG